MHDAKIVPIESRRRTEPTLFGVDRNRLEAARHKAANMATAASLSNRPLLYRQWMRIVERLDDTLSQDGAA
jgi:hypothetical protein